MFLSTCYITHSKDKMTWWRCIVLVDISLQVHLIYTYYIRNSSLYFTFTTRNGIFNEPVCCSFFIFVWLLCWGGIKQFLCILFSLNIHTDVYLQSDKMLVKNQTTSSGRMQLSTNKQDQYYQRTRGQRVLQTRYLAKS